MYVDFILYSFIQDYEWAHNKKQYIWYTWFAYYQVHLSNKSSVMWCPQLFVFALCLTLWKNTISTDRFPSLALFHFPLSLLLRLYSSAAHLSAYLLGQIFIFCSSFLCCDASLVLSRVFLFHDMLCCVTAAAWSFSLFLLLLLHPGSPTTLTYVSASDAIIYKCTVHMTMPNSSLILLLTPMCSAWMLLSSISLQPALCLHHHVRTSWDRSTVHLGRLWARLPAAWRNN